jgi:chaperonin GroEL
MSAPNLLFADDAAAALRRGALTMVQLLAQSFGPGGGRVLVARDGSPELLDDGATVARRTVEMPNRADDMGAQAIRHLSGRVRERVGDGATTAALLAGALLAGGWRLCAAGVDPIALARGLHAGGLAALAALQAQARPLAVERDLRSVASSVGCDERLAVVLAELHTLLGPEGWVTIEDYVAPYMEREYHAGASFKARLADPAFITSQVLGRAALNDAATAIYAGPITEARELLPLLAGLAQQGQSRLLLVAEHIGGEALDLLRHNHLRGRLRIVAVELRAIGQQLNDDEVDLAALAGARLRAAILGERAASLCADDAGTARRVEVRGEELRVVPDRRHRTVGCEAVAERLNELRARLSLLSEHQSDERRVLRQRIARLDERTATLRLGARTASERALLKGQAERGLRVFELAHHHGVVVGGGAALLHSATAVRGLALHGDERYGAELLADALSAPLRQIVANAGRHEPATIVATLAAQPGHTYDALTGAIVDETKAPLDAIAVQSVALESALSLARTLLTTEVLVLSRAPKTQLAL